MTHGGLATAQRRNDIKQNAAMADHAWFDHFMRRYTRKKTLSLWKHTGTFQSQASDPTGETVKNFSGIFEAEYDNNSTAKRTHT